MTDLELRRRADVVFARILELPAAERGAALERLCPEPGPLRDLVSGLLDVVDGDLGFEEALASAVGDGLATSFVADRPATGKCIGPFRIEREIGRGGMGIVYRARRIDEFEQTVALKVLMLSADARLRRRFASERSILARLEHPHIARMIDGGVTAEGTPWFAMEYVDGKRLDEHLADGPDLQPRLELFLQVARAVEFAHRRLLIHCDIKPANVLVDEYGRARLLDFGIGRMLESDAIGETQTRGFVTPQYASPEQVLGERLTPATDIYQLGLLLYEMLAGTRPYAVSGKTPAEVQQVICVDEPSRPSRVTTADGPASPPGVPARRLRGDLDTIVMTAMEKTTELRYPSVSALIADVEAYLEKRPIAARAPSIAHRSSKFVRRHPVGSGAGVVILVLVIGWAFTLVQQRGRVIAERDAAQRESRRAEEALAIVFDVFTSNDPHQGNPADVTARQLLDRAAERIDGDESLDVELAAELTYALAKAYDGLWLPASALSMAKRSAELHRAAYGPGDPRVAPVLLLSGSSGLRAGDFVHGEEALVELLELARSTAVDPAIAADAHFELARVQSRMRRYDEAAKTFRSWFELVPESHPDLVSGTGHAAFARLLAAAARFEEAQANYEEASRRKVAFHGDDSLAAVNARAAVAENLIRIGEVDRGLGEARAALEQIHAKLGTRTVDYGATQQRLAAALLRAGRNADAGEMARASLRSLEGHEVNPALIGLNHVVLAEVALGSFELEAARRHVSLALTDLADDGGHQTARCLELQARIEVAAGDAEAARAALREAARIYARIPGEAGRLEEVRAALLELSD